MPLTIGTNINSLRIQGNLNIASRDLASTYQRLSSGLRISKGSDDPAGLALSTKLATDSRIAAAAVRNTNDGISMVSVADSALTEVNNVLTRMLELSTQSANSTITTATRSALSSEFISLGSEIDRIARTTTFNNFNLLSSGSNLTLQVGLDSSFYSQISLSAVRGTLDSLGLASSGSSSLTYSIISTSTNGSAYAATVALSAVQSAVNSLTVVRGIIDAQSSRLSKAVSYLEVIRENYAAAADTIRDVDVAVETTNLVSLQIKQQAATALLAQANQTPALVLKLLG